MIGVGMNTNISNHILIIKSCDEIGYRGMHLELHPIQHINGECNISKVSCNNGIYFQRAEYT